MTDRRRFEQQVLPHIDAAFNLARWLTRNDHDAEDVVQDAMLRAYRHFEGLRGEARPWLLAIVRNACFSWMQRNRPAELLLARELDRRMLNEAIAALPLQFREVLILRELEDLSYREIARIANVPIGTVMSRLARARRLLAESVRVIAVASRLQTEK